MNQTLTEKARSLRLQASMPKSFWEDALTYAYFLVSKSPHRKLNKRLPMAIWREKNVKLGHLNVFGYPAYTLVEEADRSKLDPKS